MEWIRDTPIRRKLTVAFALVIGGALLVAMLILLVTDLVHIRRDETDQLRAVAELIGANSSAAITFGDQDAAAETLETLRAITDVTDAVLYDRDGQVLARYARDDAGSRRVVVEERDETRLIPTDIVVARDIGSARDRVGSVVLRSDVGSGYAALRRDALATLAIAGVAFLFALAVGIRLQRLVTVPIARLLGLAQRVTREADYSLRARVESDDEIGRLARGFNEMLATVQRRDDELARHQSRLESEVAERTSDLERINERLTRELVERERTQSRLGRALSELERHHHESETLSEMNDRLQVCRDLAEVGPVVGLFGARLFPGSSGSVHVFDEERSRVEPVAHWGELEEGGDLGQDDCWALRRGRIHIVPEPGAELLCPHVGSEPPAGGCLCVPMLAHGHVAGFLHVRFPAAGPSCAEDGDPRPARACESLATSVAERIALAVASIGIQSRLREQSVRDALTGLYNRRYMEESLDREIARARRDGRPLAVAMLDLDHFKHFNDAYGHDAGDVVLRELGCLLREGVRAGDVACRFGGEEFTLIFPATGTDAARKRAEEIGDRVRDLQIEHRGESVGRVTISIGVAVCPEHGATADELIHAADEALYEAKAAGRDRVAVYEGRARGTASGPAH